MIVREAEATPWLLNREACRIYGINPAGEWTVASDIERGVEMRQLDGRLLPDVEWPAARAGRREFVQHFEAVLVGRASQAPQVVRLTTQPLPADGAFVMHVLDVEKLRTAQSSRLASEQQLALERESLEESDERFRRVFERSPSGVALVDADGVVRECNPALAALLMLDGERATGGPLLEWIVPDDRDGHRAAIDRLATGRADSVSEERRYLRSDGETIWVLEMLTPLGAPSDRRPLLGLFVHDLTARRQAVAAVPQSEDDLRRFIDYAPAAMAMLDTDLRYVAASGRWLRDYRLPAEGLQGRHHYDVFPEIPDHWKGVHRRALVGQPEHCEEDLFVRPDGERTWIRWDVRPWHTGSGTIGGIIIYSEDVTAAKAAEAALVDNARTLALALDAAGAGTWSFDLRAKRGDADDRHARWFGVEEGRPAGLEAWVDAVHPSDRARMLARIAQAISGAGNREWDLEYRVLRPDGRTTWLQSVGRIERDDAGAAVRISGITLEVTARREADERLARSHAALQAQSGELEGRVAQLARLASDMTLAEQRIRERLARTLHDHLQQTLFSALLALDRLEQQSPRGDAAASLLAGLRGNIREALETTRTLSVELVPPVLQQSGLPAALEWLAVWMHDKYELEVELRVESDADPGSPDLRALVFESIRELLFNVVKHAHVARATISSEPIGADAIRIRVIDEGSGFGGDDIARSGLGADTGLGLDAMRERLQLMGGRLDIESTVGRGTTATIVVPRRRADAPTAGVA